MPMWIVDGDRSIESDDEKLQHVFQAGKMVVAEGKDRFFWPGLSKRSLVMTAIVPSSDCV